MVVDAVKISGRRRSITAGLAIIPPSPINIDSSIITIIIIIIVRDLSRNR
jgi:hypothetical protein